MSGYSKIESDAAKNQGSSTDPESLNRNAAENHRETERDPAPPVAEKSDGVPRLSRNRSVSSTVQTTTPKKGQFVPMMRRSASVASERYGRIHDQNAVNSRGLGLEEEEEDGSEAVPAVVEEKKKKKKNKIMKFCKRFLGL